MIVEERCYTLKPGTLRIYYEDYDPCGLDIQTRNSYWCPIAGSSPLLEALIATSMRQARLHACYVSRNPWGGAC